MTAREWMKANVGKKIDYDGAYNYQCVDVIKKYYKEIIGINPQKGNAIDYWTTYPTGSFTKVKNTPSGVPPIGSIIIWNLGKYGHIGVVYSANVNQFETFEQNWKGTGLTPTEFRVHNYSNVLGWLIPKKDVNFDQAAWDAAVAAQKVKEEEARLAKEEADRIAREEAARIKAEQEKLAKEQEKLEAELKAKLEAEAKAEAERAEAEAKAEREKMKYTFTKENLIKIAKGAGIAVGGALLVYVAEILPQVDFGVWTPLVGALSAILINAARQFIKE